MHNRKEVEDLVSFLFSVIQANYNVSKANKHAAKKVLKRSTETKKKAALAKR